MAINIDFSKMHGNILKSLASIFQVAIRFHPRHLPASPLKFNVFIFTLTANFEQFLFPM